MLQDALDWLDEHRVLAISLLNSSILLTLAVLLAAASLDEGTKTAWAEPRRDEVDAPTTRRPADEALGRRAAHVGSPASVRPTAAAPRRARDEEPSRPRDAQPTVRRTTVIERSVRRPQSSPTVSRPRAFRAEASTPRGLPKSR